MIKRASFITSLLYVYKVNCPDCKSIYIGESGRRIEERALDHAGRDLNSHVYFLSTR